MSDFLKHYFNVTGVFRFVKLLRRSVEGKHLIGVQRENAAFISFFPVHCLRDLVLISIDTGCLRYTMPPA